MANETTYTSFDAASIQEGVANEHILDALYDLNFVTQLTRFVNLAGVPSKSHKVGLWPRLAAATVAEGVEASVSQVNSTNVTVTASEKAIVVEPTDALKLSSLVNDGEFAMACAQAIAEKKMSDVANLASGFSNTVGSTGVNLTEQNFLDAAATLDNNRQHGRKRALLYTQQYYDLLASIGSTFNPASTAGQAVRSEMNDFYPADFGDMGPVLGVHTFTSTAVPTAAAGADSAGMMINAQRAIARGVKYESRTEFERNAKKRSTEIVVTAFDGVVEIEDAAGVGIVTDR